MTFFRRRKASSHEAVLSDVTLHCMYCFNVGSNENMYKIADRLLRSGFAINAASPGSAEFRINYDASVDLKDVEILASLPRLLRSKAGFLRWIIWSLKHPRVAARRHPIVKVKYALGKAYDARSTQQAKELEDAVMSLSASVLEAQKVVQALCAVDRDVYHAGYIANDPFIRLDLAPLSCKTSGSSSLPVNEIQPIMLLHRSGVVILTFVLTMPDEFKTSQMRTLLVSGDIEFSEISVPAPIVNPRHHGIRGLFRKGSDKKVSSYDLAEGTNLVQLFEIYAERVAEASRQRGPRDWFCYKALFVEGLGCCGSRDRWMENHRRELAAISLGVDRPSDLNNATIDAELKSDWALHQDRTTYFHGGQSLSIAWKFGRDRGIDAVDHFLTTVVVENALLRFWQLESLAQDIDRRGWKSAALAELQVRAVVGLKEYHKSRLVYGTALEIVRAINSEQGTDVTYAGIGERLTQLQTLLGAAADRRSSRRNLLFAALAAVTAIVLGLPAIDQSLDIIGQLPPRSLSGSLAGPLLKLHRMGASGTWIAYLIFLAVVAVVLVITFAWRSSIRPVKYRRGAYGRTWPGPSIPIRLSRSYLGRADPRGDVGD